jgi:hypothetical protein
MRRRRRRTTTRRATVEVCETCGTACGPRCRALARQAALRDQALLRARW